MRAGIIPAVIPKTFEDIISCENSIRELVPTFQIDVIDGIFAKPISWPHKEEVDMELMIDNLLREIVLEFEVDMMVENVEPWVKFWIDGGAQRIIFHFKAVKNKKILMKNINLVKEHGIEVGMAIGVYDNPLAIKEFAPFLDVIQCMGIKHIGVQGEPLTNEVYALLETVKTLYSNIRLSVDGGVNINNLEKLIESGANSAVSGSFIFKNGDIEGNINKLQNVCK